MSRLVLSVLLCTFAFACVRASPRPPSSSESAETAGETAPLAADTPITLSTGATLTAPAGWQLIESEGRTTLRAPEDDTSVELLLSDEADLASAIASAWSRVQPGFARKVLQQASPPARDGIDAITQIVYETSTDERRVVIGVALRKAPTTYVFLIDGAKATVDKRAAQINLPVASLQIPGAEKESFAGRQAHPLDDARLAAFESFVEQARTDAEVPGVAVAIVQGGKVVFEKGFGVREKGSDAPITPETLFMIGSTTKSLTTLMMSVLVDEGRFDWDTPVVELMPSFALGDPEATRKLAMKHTVCACTGLPRQDMEFLFEYAGVTPEQRIEAMRSMRPTTGFGETFQYSNPLVAAGGYVAARSIAPEKALADAFDEALRTRVLDPLGMKATTFDFAQVARREHAMPHGYSILLDYAAFPLEGELSIGSVGPAGAAWSNVRDMSRYLLLELARGTTRDGTRIVSEANLLRRWEPQVRISDQNHYGLGLFIDRGYDVPVIGHGGNTLGFTSDLFFLPEHDVGLVVLANAGQANAFRGAVRRRFLELLFDGREEASQNLAFLLKAMREQHQKRIAKLTRAPERSWLESLAGTWVDSALGQLTITIEGDRAMLDAGEWRSPIGRIDEADGVVKACTLEPPLAGLELRIQEKDGVRILVLERPQQRYEFTPVAAK